VWETGIICVKLTNNENVVVKNQKNKSRVEYQSKYSEEGKVTHHHQRWWLEGMPLKGAIL
jgi:hypothetical protein